MATKTIAQYFEYVDKYSKLYGEKSVVLIQIGSFYECYEHGYKDDNDMYVIPPKIEELSRLLDCVLTQRNTKNNNGLNCPFMFGFPDYKIDMYKEKLVRFGYSVIIVSQVTLPPEPKRDITEIITPGTYIESGKINNNLLCIYLERLTRNHKSIYLYGLAVVNIITGTVDVYETPSNEEAFKFVSIYEPQEIILYTTMEKEHQKEVHNFLELSRYNANWLPLENLDIIKNISFRSQFLSKIYKDYDFGNLDPVVYMEIERYKSAQIGLVLLFNYINKFHGSLLEKICIPHVEKPDSCLVLSHNTIQQLELLPQPDIVSLFKIIDKTQTVMGRRLLRERMLQPSSDVDEINKRLDMIDEISHVVNEISILRKIIDLDYKFRRIHLYRLTFDEFRNIDTSLEAIGEILNILYKNNKKLPTLNKIGVHKNSVLIQKLKDAREYYKKYFCVDKMTTNNDSFLQRDKFPKIDELQDTIAAALKKFNSVILKCDSLVPGSGTVEIKYNENDKYYIKIPIKRARILEKHADFKSFTFKYLKTECKITSSNLKEQSDLLKDAREKLSPLLKEAYYKTLNKWMNKYQNDLEELIRCIAIIDVSASMLKLSRQNGYVRPILTESDHSGVVAIKMRHPVVERIIDSPFVSNDFDIGREKPGWLLYGPNMAGKSTFMRSPGLNVILAQMGSHVACESMKLMPFTKLMTRIVGGDNQSKGMSKFMIEMCESRIFLQDADKRTLVLGDEICNGTENSSALGLVAAAIDILVKRKVCFLFATHLHQLTTIKEVSDLIKSNDIYVCHASVETVAANLKLNFNRKLQQGQGPSNYGIEIAKGLGLPLDYINLAMEIRNRIDNTDIINNKKSRYHNKIHMTECTACGARKNLETHHKIEQRTADEYGFVVSESGDKFHKNSIFNLAVLCDECHLKITIQNAKQKNTK